MFEVFSFSQHLLLLVFIAVVIRGWHIATRPGMLLAPIGRLLLYNQAEKELSEELPQLFMQEKVLLLMSLEEGIMAIPEDETPMRKRNEKEALINEFEKYLKEHNQHADKTIAAKQKSLLQSAKLNAWKKYIGKPLGECIACASSVFGILGMTLAYYPLFHCATWWLWLVWVISIPAITGLNSLVKE